jgi:putative heme-binding domain-containing protein
VAVAVPKAAPSNRGQAWELYRPAIARKGDAARGLAVFEARCAMCHRAAGKGATVGPDLDAARQAGREKVLGNILEPSREITAGYPLATVTMKDGTSAAGILSNETAAGVLLRIPGGVDYPAKRADIAKVERSDKSLMPEGIEAGLTMEQMADLLEFLCPM